MKMVPSRMAIMIRVLAAFFGSGGLKAGTPLAIASTPVRATEPPANALSNRKTVSIWVSGWMACNGSLRWWAFPETTLTTPTTTASRAMTTNM